MSQTFLSQLETRYATKQYDPSFVVSDSDRDQIEKAIKFAPTSLGMQAFNVIRIDDKAMLEKIAPAAYNQPSLTTASLVYVFVAQNQVTPEFVQELAQRVIKTRDLPADGANELVGMIDGASASLGDNVGAWLARQTYIALGFGLAACAELGLDSTPMEGFDPETVNSLLGLVGQSAIVILTVGKRSSQDGYAQLAKVRKDVLIVR